MGRADFEHLELLAEIDAMVARLNRWADDAPAWTPAERCQAMVRRLTERTESLRVRIEAPLVVATLGGSGSGKSALVNALAGAEVVRTGRARPTTTRPTLVCRPGLTSERLGIDPATVERVECDLPALRDLVLVDCPDPDTSEDAAAAHADGNAKHDVEAESPSLAASNLARLRAILPKCDVLLVVGTQQKYRSARVAEELSAAAAGATLVFVQTHAELDDDIRDDWRRTLEEEKIGCGEIGHVFRVDSLRELANAQAGMQPRGEFADLLDLLTRRMAGAAAHRIRRANFLDLAAETLAACRQRLDEATPNLRQAQAAVEEERAKLASQIAAEMQAELLASRRQWENRLLAQTASRWGFSPFALVLRIDLGIGGLLSGALLYRMRTPAQMALWGTFEGLRTWRRHRQDEQADRGVDRAASAGWKPAELRKAALIVEGYAAEAGLDARAARWETVSAEAETAAGGFVAHVAADLTTLIARLARRHTGWFTRWRYELLLLAMLGVLLYRLGKNFFYDSWLATPPQPVFGLNAYLQAGFWLLLWCVALLWAFCRRLRRGLQGEIAQLADGWKAPSSASSIFAKIEDQRRRADQFRQELDAVAIDVEQLQHRVADVPA